MLPLLISVKQLSRAFRPQKTDLNRREAQQAQALPAYF